MPSSAHAAVRPSRGEPRPVIAAGRVTAGPATRPDSALQVVRVPARSPASTRLPSGLSATASTNQPRVAIVCTSVGGAARAPVRSGRSQGSVSKSAS